MAGWGGWGGWGGGGGDEIHYVSFPQMLHPRNNTREVDCGAGIDSSSITNYIDKILSKVNGGYNPVITTSSYLSHIYQSLVPA